MILRLLSVFFLIETSSAYLFNLNDIDYVRMPPMFNLEPFESCVHDSNDTGVYCSVKFALVSDHRSDLNDMIRNYSARTESHFNHSELFYGICLTKTCKDSYKHNRTEDPGLILEECLNKSLWDDYKLKARLEQYWCEKQKKLSLDSLDTSDYAVAGVIGALLILNLVGSLQKKCCQENAFLCCFSIPRNWRRLTATSEEGPEPRITRLNGLHGIKAISMMVIIATNSLLPIVVNGDNTHFIEEGYRKWYFLLIANGPLVMQTFFLQSGMLLSYHFLLDSEKQKVTWLAAPKRIISKYISATAPLAIVLAIIATWVRHFSIGTGPLWQPVVMSEINDCRRDWWMNLLYIINYVDNSNCMTHTWYLAAEFQLYVIGVAICVLTSGMFRKFVLAILFIAGMTMPAVYTYLRDLEGTLILSPETFRNMFITDDTFNHVYKRGHTNLASFVIGLGLGQLVYHWQCYEHKFQSSAICRFMIWLTFPVIVSLGLLSGVFYRDSPRASIYIRMAFAIFLKPAFTGVIALLVIGIVFNFEDMYRGILEWSGWTLPSRLSYCAYVVHVLITKLLTGTGTTLTHVSFLHMSEIMTSTITISFMAAIFLYLMVEAPTHQLIKLCTSGRPEDERDNYTINKTISTIGNRTKNGWQQDLDHAAPNVVRPNREKEEISKTKDEEVVTHQKETKIGSSELNSSNIHQEATVIEIQDNRVINDDEKQINMRTMNNNDKKRH